MVSDTGRRIHAAQAYGGFTSIPALAAAINRPGFGEGTLRRVIAGTRPLEEHERGWLESVTGVPAEFFESGFDASAPTEDGATLAGNAEKLDQLTGEISELRRTVREEADELLTMRGEVLGRIYERISQIDERLGRIGERVETLTQRDTDVESAMQQLQAAADAFAAASGAQPSTTGRRRAGTPRGTTPAEASEDPGGHQR